MLTSFAVSASDRLSVGELSAPAQYFPQNTMLYGSISTSDATISQIDGLLVRMRERLPNAGIPTLRETIDLALIQTLFVDFDGAIRPWLGDVAALGMWQDPLAPGGTNALFVVGINNRQQLMDFIAGLERTAGQSAFTVQDRGEYVLYTPINGSGALALTENVAIFGNSEADIVLNRSSNLASRSDFNSAMNQLPAPDYAGVLYVNTANFIAMSSPNLGQIGLPGSTGLGLSILDGDTMVFDLVQLPGEGQERFPALDTLDPSFLRYVPADASFTIHATNLNATYNGTVENLRTVALSSGGMTDQEFEAGLRQIDSTVRLLLNMDLQTDILSWMTGDYALFMTIDEEAIFSLVPQAVGSASGPLSIDTLPFEIGLVIEATNPAAAQQFSASLASVIERLVAQDPAARVSQQQIGGTQVTVVTIDVPVDAGKTLTLEVAIGANDRVFVLGTLNAVTSVLTGAPGLDTSVTYQEAARYVLENATTAVYMDNYGLAVGIGVPTVVVLALLGPSIGNIFENIAGELESSALPSPAIYAYDPSAARLQPVDPIDQFRQGMGIISSASISAAINAEGSTVFRIALTLR